jgi:hypothetical protein
VWHETPHRRCQRTTVLVLRLLDVPAQLENVDDDKDNVILLVHCSRSPPLAFGEHLTGQFGGGLQWIIAYDPVVARQTRPSPRSQFRSDRRSRAGSDGIIRAARYAPDTRSQVRLRTIARYFRCAAFRPSYSVTTVTEDVHQPNRAPCGSLCRSKHKPPRQTGRDASLHRIRFKPLSTCAGSSSRGQRTAWPHAFIPRQRK